MGKIESVKLSRKELDSGFIPFNYVMVEAEKTAEGKRSKGGIIVGHDEDATFYSSEESPDVSHEADIAQVCAKVYKVPNRLYFNKEDRTNSMSWDCDMELSVGDKVWFGVIESRNATAVECEDHLYKLIPYSDCYVAKREIPTGSWDVTVNICLNGYVLLEPVFIENKSILAISPKGEVDRTRGIVRYAGKPNREYLKDQYIDFPYLEDGDLVLFSPNTSPFLLERKRYLAEFEGDKLFWVVQRRRISIILEKGK